MTTDSLSDGLESAAESASWLDDASQEPEEFEVDEYDIVSSPNDWNVATIVNFIESGAVKIPPFQRNYVWDIKRASKLIESLILGLPVPQVFLYEEKRNSFLVIDGQQRLLSIFFFAKGRFPRSNSRGSIRSLLNEGQGIRESALQDDALFQDFPLRLPKSPTGQPNKFNGLKFATLGDYQITLNLRTLRNVVVKQTHPSGDSSIFEIFSRLNTGGINLSQQEIRASLYHSELISNILTQNESPLWRQLIGLSTPDSRMRDFEVILRSLALARGAENYAGSMAAFINKFCIDAQSYSSDQTKSAIVTFQKFLELSMEAGGDLFKRQSKFSGVLFESFFAAWVHHTSTITPSQLRSAVLEVRSGDGFAATLQEGSTKSINVKERIRLANGALLSSEK